MEKKFDTLENYLIIAKKTINNFGKRYYPSLVKEMLNCEETISSIAHAIMLADWKWDDTRVGKVSGKSKSQYSFRNQHAIWAIKKCISNKYTPKRQRQKIGSEFTLENISRNNEDPSIQYEENDHIQSLQKNINDLLNFAPISDKQKEQIRMYYYEDKTLQQIGDHYGVTKEAIRLNIKKAIATIREMVNYAS